MKGLYHVHSKFSYDGTVSIGEIADWAKGENLDFVIITEHDVEFCNEKFSEFISGSNEQDSGVKIITGIEYSFDKEEKRIHVGVLGLTCFIKNDANFENLSDFLDKVKNLGGVSILNHPVDIINMIPGSILKKFDLVEIWNTKYDHCYSPNLKNLKIVSHSVFDKYYIASSDIHAIPRESYVVININENSSYKTTEEIILRCLKNGCFSISYKNWSISSKAEIKTKYLYQKLMPYISFFHKKLYDFLKSIAHKLNYKPPSFIVKLLKLES